MATTPKICKDCAPSAGSLPRPAPNPGPRCATHWRQFKREQKAKRHEAYVSKTYSLEQREYEKLYEGQDGTCAICKRATGATRKLSVDHDHKCCSGSISCGFCVRGLLCRPCNDLLGHARDDWNFFARAIRYILCPPAVGILGKKRPDPHAPNPRTSPAA